MAPSTYYAVKTRPASSRATCDAVLRVHWHNHQRLHGYLGDVPPAEFEARSYATQQGDQALVEIK